MAITMDLLSSLDPTSVLIFTATLLTGSYLNGVYQRHKNLPPGPLTFPFLGNMPQIVMGRRKHKRNYDVFQELRQQYGDLFRISMGSKPMVFIFGPKYIKEVLVEKGQYFINRSQTELAVKLSGQKGIIFTNGHPWKEMRRFTLMTMRDFGLGKKSLESRVQDEVKIMIEEFASQKGAFFPKRMYLNAISNNICALVFGQRYEYTDPEFQKVLDVLDYLSQNAGAEMPENFLPFLTHVPGYPSKVRQLVKNNLVMRAFILSKLEEHRQTFDKEDIRDFMDLYIDIEVNGSTNDVLTEENMFRTIMDFFSAGTETTATTMTWITLYICRAPHVLKKCQEEIDRVVGQGRMVNLQDKPDMPYMMAAIQEAQRIASVVPCSLPRETTADVRVGEHVLPKGTMIMPYTASVHWDPEVFPDPMEYKPERWIDDKGQLKRMDFFMPFSQGPRSCLGEPLARMQLFLFLANLCQAMDITIHPDHTEIDMDGYQQGLIHHTSTYYMTAKKRA